MLSQRGTGSREFGENCDTSCKYFRSWRSDEREDFHWVFLVREDADKSLNWQESRSNRARRDPKTIQGRFLLLLHDLDQKPAEEKKRKKKWLETIIQNEFKIQSDSCTVGSKNVWWATGFFYRMRRYERDSSWNLFPPAIKYEWKTDFNKLLSVWPSLIEKNLLLILSLAEKLHLVWREKVSKRSGETRLWRVFPFFPLSPLGRNAGR